MIFILAAIVIAVAVYFAVRKTPSDYDIEKIKDGDTKDQVISVFGKPRQVVKPSFPSDEEWIYAIPFRLFISIGFNSEGRVNKRYRSGAI